MPQANWAYDAIGGLKGIWGGNPDYVPQGFAHQAVNCFFREDTITQRPSIQGLELTFETEEDRIWFAAANGQGAFFYNAFPSFNQPQIIVSLGGRIYRIQVVGRQANVLRLFDGNYRIGMYAWFAQGYEYLLIQDGVSPPMVWNGLDAPYRSDPNKNQVPIGSVMAFIHGRFIVASSDGKNTIRLSEIALIADRTTILTFPPELPTYSIAANLGEIMGLFPMPYLDSGTGNFELTALCQNGFTSFDFRGEESTFLGQVQKISLVGVGCTGTNSFAGMNSDLFFRTSNGINTYRNSRLEFTQAWDQTSISREVNYWTRDDRADLLGTIPMVGWNSMVFTGCSPQIQAPTNACFGYHRFCRGFTVFDAQNMSTAGRDGTPVWHGMWTGIRPWAFVNGKIGTADRCFAFSFDRDGQNRLYEITLTPGPDQLGTIQSPIFSYLTTGTLGAVEARTSTFNPKRLNGGTIEVGGITRSTEINVDYRPDSSPCWLTWDSLRPGCDCPTFPTDACGISQPMWVRKYLNPQDQLRPIPGTCVPANLFHHCQVRIRGNGNFVLSRFQIRMDLQPDAETPLCVDGILGCPAVQCCPAEFDYSYNIAPAGTNTEVPVLECLPVAPTYQSTRFFRAVCAGNPNISVTAQGQATSTISQTDADQKALANAQSNAQAQLVCPNCTPQNLLTFEISGGGSIDLSIYFLSGLYAGMYGMPVRLYDEFLTQYIAIGQVNQSGTLTLETVYPQYMHGTYDTTSHIYSDVGAGQTRISLQIGCSGSGNTVWPDPSGPYVV